MAWQTIDRTVLESVKEKIVRGFLPQWAFSSPDIYEHR